MISLRKNPSLFAASGLVVAFALGTSALAQEEKPGEMPSVDTKVQQSTDDRTTEKRKQVVKEAMGAIRETQNALRSLDEGNSEEALAALEQAAGKLAIILAREPELALAPAGVNTVTVDVLVSQESIERITEEAEDALADGRIQRARRLIDDLASETVISVTNIPLATYPDAIGLAAGLIDDGELGSARDVLQTALNTLVVTDTVIPLPIAAAQQLMRDAQDLAQKEGRSEDDNSKLSDLLQAAHRELEFADALGYGAEEELASLHDQVNELEEHVDAGGSGDGLFAPIRELLDDTVQSSQPETG